MLPRRNASPRTRLLGFPPGQSPAGGRLETLRLETDGLKEDLVMEYHELLPAAPQVLFERDGVPWEQVQGEYQPRCLRFYEAQIVNGRELGTAMDTLPGDDPARSLSSALAWQSPEGDRYYLFGVRLPAHSSLLLTAARCASDNRPGPAQPATLIRDWSPVPLLAPRSVPVPARLRQRFGGDPVAVWLDGCQETRRLFIGGVDIQGEQRPDVAAVLNVGETPSRWTEICPPHTADRWENKGEGLAGMSVEEIAAEARWVIDWLQAGRRVLVHCAAGMNRSSTICSAVLILLEGLSAEAALERVRQHHPWARPDPHHWLRLKWLAQQSKA